MHVEDRSRFVCFDVVHAPVRRSLRESRLHAAVAINSAFVVGGNVEWDERDTERKLLATRSAKTIGLNKASRALRKVHLGSSLTTNYRSECGDALEN